MVVSTRGVRARGLAEVAVGGAAAVAMMAVIGGIRHQVDFRAALGELSIGFGLWAAVLYICAGAIVGLASGLTSRKRVVVGFGVVLAALSVMWWAALLVPRDGRLLDPQRYLPFLPSHVEITPQHPTLLTGILIGLAVAWWWESRTADPLSRPGPRMPLTGLASWGVGAALGLVLFIAIVLLLLVDPAFTREMSRDFRVPVHPIWLPLLTLGAGTIVGVFCLQLARRLPAGVAVAAVLWGWEGLAALQTRYTSPIAVPSLLGIAPLPEWPSQMIDPFQLLIVAGAAAGVLAVRVGAGRNRRSQPVPESTGVS